MVAAIFRLRGGSYQGKIFLDKLKINERKYPVEKVNGKAHKYTVYSRED